MVDAVFGSASGGGMTSAKDVELEVEAGVKQYLGPLIGGAQAGQVKGD